MRAKERVAFRRRSVGFVWQQTSRNLLPYLTASENVAAALAITGEPKGGAARRARVTGLLDLLERRATARPAARRAVGRAAAARRDRGRHRQRAQGAARRRAHGGARRHHERARARGDARSEPRTRRDDTDRDPRPQRVGPRARTVQIRDGRTSTEVLRSTSARRARHRGARRRGVRGARQGRPPAAARRVRDRASTCAIGCGWPSSPITSGSGRAGLHPTPAPRSPGAPEVTPPDREARWTREQRAIARRRRPPAADGEEASMTALRAEKLTRTFSTSAARRARVRDVDLEVRPGELRRRARARPGRARPPC